MAVVVMTDDKKNVFQLCQDARIQKSDGFTFGIAFSLRPKVDQISLLAINTINFAPETYGGYMVEFAGRKYAARSPPTFVANSTYMVATFTLVFEFKGTWQNLCRK
ncbi:hypothetical protein AMTR_s00009p00088580 [Amborella trichopoda]|uniref:Uncharacterized protein n=1 Tax=Amborella trichopoda TaxID=13333 RepID=W1NH99_AMBTC|nr:hypothetical protein AMTR_s00009p00088580 [Amborella trichopoda]